MIVVVALLANLLVAVAKTVAAVMTGSASLTAEAAHSWADAANEVFLLVADHRAARKRDESHPLGFGREAYVWSLFAAFGVFTIGAVVSVWRGIQELRAPSPSDDFLVAYVVLGVSFVLEGVSFVQSLAKARRRAKKFKRGTLDYVLNGSDATLRAVFGEDAAALVGIVIAAGGIALHQLTGQAVWDAIGSILVGVLLAALALVLIDRNRRFLVGAEPPDRFRKQVGRLLLDHRDIERLTFLHLEFIGPSRVFLVAAVDLVGNAKESEVAERLHRLSREIEENELIELAILTLSRRDATSIEVAKEAVREPIEERS